MTGHRDRVPGSGPDSIEAMAALAPLIGVWAGTGRTRTESGWVEFEQTERVQPVMGGGLLTVEGCGSRPGAPDDVRFRAFAVARFDPASGEFLWRANTPGHSVEVPLVVGADGFRWGYETGASRMSFDIRIDGDAWTETGVVVGGPTTGGHPAGGTAPMPTLQMTLRRKDGG